MNIEYNHIIIREMSSPVIVDITCTSHIEFNALDLYLRKNWDRVFTLPLYKDVSITAPKDSVVLRIQFPKEGSNVSSFKKVLNFYTHCDEKGNAANWKYWLELPDFEEDKNLLSDFAKTVKTTTYERGSYNYKSNAYKNAERLLERYKSKVKLYYDPITCGQFYGKTSRFGDIRDEIKKVQVNDKKKVVTIVWKDNSVTIARCGANDIWDVEKGILVCIAKRYFCSGTQMNKWLRERLTDVIVERFKSDENVYKPKHAGNE